MAVPIPQSREEPERRSWTCDEYERLAELGLLRPDERVELIEGEIFTMSPQNADHSTGVDLAAEAIRGALRSGYFVRQQHPLRLVPRSEPEPDVAVVPGRIREYSRCHPVTASLVIEVSDSSLNYDRTRKASLYASAGIPDYWIVDLRGRRVEVRREPAEMPGEPLAHGYRTVSVYVPGEEISCPNILVSPIAVDDLLPDLDKETGT